MAIHQDTGDAMCISVRLLEHGELIGIHRLIFVNPGLNMPACKVAAIAAGKSSRAQAPNGNSLPIAVVNISGNARNPRVVEWKSEWTLPCSLGDRIASPCRGGTQQQERTQQNLHRRAFQKTSEAACGVCVFWGRN